MMRINKTVRVVLLVPAALAAAAVLFIAVSWIVEYRPAERETLFRSDDAQPLPDTLTVLSWNIGYAGLGDNMDFFYDGGRRVRDTRERTAVNLHDVIETIRRQNADIVLLQEVDLNSRRTYGIREVDSLRAAFPDYTLSFAYNYHAWWVPIPLRSPMGRVRSGVVTLSRFVPKEVIRYQYPSAFSFPVRLFNLKRCLLCAEFVTRSGDTVWINNTHNTAYDTGGMRSAETEFLGGLLEEGLKRGIASVTGGDWNQYPPGYRPTREELSNPYFVPEAADQSLVGDDFRFVFDPSQPTLRYLDRPYAVPAGEWGGEKPRLTTLTDFFLVSNGVRVLSVATLPLGFRSSDHNPVLLKISLEQGVRRDGTFCVK